MKKPVMILLGIILMATSVFGLVINSFSDSSTSGTLEFNYNYVECYQEFANVSTACGGLSTGSYNYTGQVNSSAVDGDWSTYIDGAGYLYVNYTVPVHTTSATWLFRQNMANNSVTLPESCFNTDKAQLRLYSESVGAGPFDTLLSCHNGTGFQQVFYSVYGYFAEEAIRWTIINETSQETTYLSIPINAEISSANINLEGYSNYFLHGFNVTPASVPMTNQRDIASNGTNIFGTHVASGTIYVHDFEGTHIDDFAHGHAGTHYFLAVTYNGSSIFASTVKQGGGDENITRYAVDGTKYETWAHGLTGADLMTSNGSHLFIVDSTIPTFVHIFENDGVYTGNYTIAETTHVRALDYYDNTLYLSADDTLLNYDLTGTWTGENETLVNTGAGMVFAEDRLYQLEAGNNDNWIVYYTAAHEFPLNITVGSTPINHTNNATTDITNPVMSSVDNSACSCTGCVISGSLCMVPLVFYPEIIGNLSYSGIEVNYTYNFTVYAYEEVGLSQLTDFNVYMYSLTDSRNASTTTGAAYLNDLETGDYTVDVSSDGYITRSYVVTIGANETVQNLTAYLNSSAENVTYILKDSSTNSIVEGGLIIMERIYGSEWQQIQSKYTDVTGRASFQYLPETNYRWTISKDGYTTKQFNLKPEESEYEVTITPSVSLEEDLQYPGVNIEISPKYFWNNQTTQVNYTIFVTNGELSEWWINVSWNNVSNYTYSTDADGGRISVSIFIDNATWTDKVKIEYAFFIEDEYRTFTSYRGILGGTAPFTFASLKDQTFGLQPIELAIICTIIIMLVGAVAFMVGGSLPASIIMLALLGFMTWMGWMPWYVLTVVGFMTVLLIIARLRGAT